MMIWHLDVYYIQRKIQVFDGVDKKQRTSFSVCVLVIISAEYRNIKPMCEPHKNESTHRLQEPTAQTGSQEVTAESSVSPELL